MLEDHPDMEDTTFNNIREVIQGCLKDTIQNQRAEGYLESLISACSRKQRKLLIETEENKHSLLSLVCEIGNVEALQFFLKCCDLDLNVKSDTCILMTAIMKGHLDIVKLLIKHGKKVTCHTDLYSCPLVVACGGYPIDFEERKITDPNDDFPYFKRTEKKYDHNYFLEFIERFPNHDCRYDMVKILIENGGLKDINEFSLYKCLKLVIDKEQWKVLELLCENIEHVEVRDYDECSILGYAVKKLRIEVVRFLIKYGANINDTRMIINEKLSKHKDTIDLDDDSKSEWIDDSLYLDSHDLDPSSRCGEENGPDELDINGRKENSVKSVVFSPVTKHENVNQQRQDKGNRSNDSSPSKKRRLTNSTGSFQETTIEFDDKGKNKQTSADLARSNNGKKIAKSSSTSNPKVNYSATNLNSSSEEELLELPTSKGKPNTRGLHMNQNTSNQSPKLAGSVNRRSRGNNGEKKDVSAHYDSNHNSSFDISSDDNDFYESKVYVHPVVYAAAKENLTLFYYLLNSEVIPFNDKMNAVEVFGARRAVELNSNAAFGIWESALLHRKHHPVIEGEITQKQDVAEPQDYLCGLQEPKTIEELDSFCPNSRKTALLIAMSVFERTIGYFPEIIMEPVKKLRNSLFTNGEYTKYVEFCNKFLPIIFTYAEESSDVYEEGLQMLRHVGLFVARLVRLNDWKPSFKVLHGLSLCFLTAGKIGDDFAEKITAYGYRDLELYQMVLHILLECDKSDKELIEFRLFMDEVIESNPRDMNMETLLHKAVKANGLLKNDLADIDFSDLEDFIVNRYDAGSADMTYLLICLGIDVNIRDRRGNTPFHTYFSYHAMVCQESLDLMVEIYKVLDQFDAHPDFVNKYGETPFSLAKEIGITLDTSWMTLQCLSANVIAKSNTPYKCLPTTLQNYVELHMKPNRHGDDSQSDSDNECRIS